MKRTANTNHRGTHCLGNIRDEKEFFLQMILGALKNVTIHEIFFETDLEIKIPKGNVFILADNALRGLGSLNFGPLPIEDIIGKVLGYSK